MGNKTHNIFMLQHEIKTTLLEMNKEFGLSYYDLLLVLQGAENEIKDMAMKHTFYEEYNHLKAMAQAQAQTGEVPSVNTSDLD